MISWILVTIAILNLADMVTTVYLVSQDGFMEANPIMRGLIETGQFAPVKTLASLFFLVFAVLIRKYYENRVGFVARFFTLATLLFPVTFLVFAVVNNIMLCAFNCTPFERVICGIYVCRAP
jgi:hypothetical protein